MTDVRLSMLSVSRRKVKSFIAKLCEVVVLVVDRSTFNNICSGDNNDINANDNNNESNNDSNIAN